MIVLAEIAQTLILKKSSYVEIEEYLVSLHFRSVFGLKKTESCLTLNLHSSGKVLYLGKILYY